MASVSSEDGFDDHLSERFDSYSLSADVSESESCASDYSYLHYVHQNCDSRSSRPAQNSSRVSPPAAVTWPVAGVKHGVISPKKTENLNKDVPEIELIKERFAKLLLGEDMSGGGKGVCTALAISNAITNLSATVFGELWKLEPLAPQKKAMWYREMEWLLCVSDSIVELTPSIQEFPGGGTFEVMVPRPRSDLYVNLPALKKLDAMLLSILDGFHDSEFYYVDRGIVVDSADDSERYPVSSSSSAMSSMRQEEKWWLPFPKVPPNGLSADARKRLQQYRECTNQILKAAMAINSGVLAEMEIPDAYLESLPKSGKACLGETIYHYVTAHHFCPESLLDLLDLSSEYTTLEIANRIEASTHIWRLKYLKKRSNHVRVKGSSWSEKVKSFSSNTEKSRIIAHRSQILLHKLRLRFPGLPQTALDMSKIQYNKDVGHAILESYSRVMESLAFNIMARIDDLLLVDDATKQRAALESLSLNDQGTFRNGVPKRKPIEPSPFTIKHTPCASPFTLPAVDSSGKRVGSSGGTYHMVKSCAGAPKMVG